MIYSKVEEIIGSETINDIKFHISIILDEKIKTRSYLNKHFQNAMTNYFLEDYGSLYLKEEYSKSSNREVRRFLTALAAQREYKGTKYMIMMNIYFDVHEQLGLVNEYRQLLRNVALQPNTFPKDSQEFISQSWKKSFGLFVLAHSFDRSLNSIFEIWNVLFVDDQIIRRRKPNAKGSLLQLEFNSKDSTLVQQQPINSQVLESTDIDSNNNNPQATSLPLKTAVAMVLNKNSPIITSKVLQIKQEISSTQCNQPCDSNSNASSTTLNYNITCKKEHFTKIEYQPIEQKVQQLEEQPQHRNSNHNSEIVPQQQLQQELQHQQQQQHYQQQHQQRLFMQPQHPQGFPLQYPEPTLARHPNIHYNCCYNSFSAPGYFLAPPPPPQMFIYPPQYSLFQQQQNQQQYLSFLEQQHHYHQLQMRSYSMKIRPCNHHNQMMA